MASAKRGRVEQRKGWVRDEVLPPGRKVIDWWSSFDNDVAFTRFTVGVPTETGPDTEKRFRVFCVNGISEGPGPNQRNGRVVTVRSIRLTGRLIPPRNPPHIEALEPTWARASIIYDRYPKWTPGPDSFGTQSQIDSMNRWTKAWQMQSARGLICSMPWGYGSSRSEEGAYLILANEVYELPPSYTKLDFGRNLRSTVPIIVSSTRGTSDGTPLGVASDELLRLRGFTASYIGQPGTGGFLQRFESGKLNTDVGSLTVATTNEAGFITQTPAIAGSITPTGFPSTTLKTVFLGTSATPDTATQAQAGWVTRHDDYLLGDEIPGPAPVEYKPLVETTSPTYEITTTAIPTVGPPAYGEERTMPIPMCSPTGILFDIYRSVDLDVFYKDDVNNDPWDPQGIVIGAIYVSIFTNYDVGWAWEGYVRITYDDQ